MFDRVITAARLGVLLLGLMLSYNLALVAYGREPSFTPEVELEQMFQLALAFAAGAWKSQKSNS